MTTENSFNLKGNLTFSTVPKLKTDGVEFIKSTENPLFNFSQVEKTDSSAIVLLLAWRREAKKNNKQIHYENIPQQLLDVAEAYGVKDLIKVTL